jgi:serine/threonine protein phosphatase PrpC
MSTEGSGASRAGGEGFHNEDVFLVEDGLGLYVVCDGASNTPAGEVAARIASRAIEEGVQSNPCREPIDRAVVEAAMGRAMASVAAAERDDAHLRGLATTVTMLLAQDTLGVVGHRGDSRAYLIRRGRAHQLTRDHELVDAPSSGSEAPDEVDVFTLRLERGDTIVLCTDGAEDVVQDAGIVRAAGVQSSRVLASRIVSEAHRRTPEQDATAVVVRVRQEHEAGWLELSGEPRGTTFGHMLQPTTK